MIPQPNIHTGAPAGLPTGVALDLKVADVKPIGPDAELPPPPPPAATTFIQPWYVLGFVSLVIAVLGVIAFFYPDDGVKVPALNAGSVTVSPEFSLYFPSWNDFFEADTHQTKDLDDILAALEAPIDPKSQVALDTTEEFRKAADMKRKPNTIQYPNDDPSVLFPAFEAFEKARKEGKLVRILHYGDSQIEGDRMSSLFRARIQERFGGSGPGLVAGKPLASSMSVVQDASESMLRFAQYGAVDKTVTHRRYGAMAIFSRFAPIVPDSAYQETDTHTGWISLGVSGGAYSARNPYGLDQPGCIGWRLLRQQKLLQAQALLWLQPQ